MNSEQLVSSSCKKLDMIIPLLKYHRKIVVPLSRNNKLYIYHVEIHHSVETRAFGGWRNTVVSRLRGQGWESGWVTPASICVVLCNGNKVSRHKDLPTLRFHIRGFRHGLEESQSYSFRLARW